MDGVFIGIVWEREWISGRMLWDSFLRAAVGVVNRLGSGVSMRLWGCCKGFILYR